MATGNNDKDGNAHTFQFLKDTSILRHTRKTAKLLEHQSGSLLIMPKYVAESISILAR